MKTKIDIKRAILERNYTIKTFADKLGMTAVNLRENIVKGNPTIKKLEQVADALNCDITDLFYPLEEEVVEHNDSPTAPMGLFTGLSASGDHTSPLPNDDHAIKLPPAQDIMPVTTFCPHCGKRVRVGVVLLPEED